MSLPAAKALLHGRSKVSEIVARRNLDFFLFSSWLIFVYIGSGEWTLGFVSKFCWEV